MTNAAPQTAPTPKEEDVRDMQARLYREIGISAVAAALRFTTQPEPSARKAVQHPIPYVLRDEDVAA